MTNTGIWTAEEAQTGHMWSPTLAAAILETVREISPSIVYDFGCGRGEYLHHLQEAGFKVKGFEGTPGIQLDIPVKIVDLTTPMRATKEKGVTMCLEVLEHIPKEFTDIVVDNILKYTDNTLILSWALVGQGGIGHVNERNADWVLKYFADRGFKLNQTYTNRLRSNAGNLWWFKKSTYVFQK